LCLSHGIRGLGPVNLAWGGRLDVLALIPITMSVHDGDPFKRVVSDGITLLGKQLGNGLGSVIIIGNLV